MNSALGERRGTLLGFAVNGTQVFKLARQKTARSCNTATGENVRRSNTIGNNNNTAPGGSALSQNTSGNYNTAVGNSAFLLRHRHGG